MNRHLFLIGMMGCGKSTLGALLSRELHAPLLDLDAEIERFEGRSIPAIFADVGDAGFRIAETAALRRACGGSPCIVATGGGIVTREENILLMRESGLVVFLCRPLEDIIAQVRQDTRPNLAGDKAERMHTLYAQRAALYRRAAHLCFDNSAPPQQAARALAELAPVREILGS